MKIQENKDSTNKKKEDGRMDELKHGQISGHKDRTDRQMSIPTFPPNSRAENRENYKRIPHPSDHPKRCLSHGCYHNRHSRSQFGSLFSSLGPKLQGELR